MRNISTKANKDLLTPDEFNSINNELENIVVNSGGTLDPAGGPDADLNMLGKAVAQYTAAANFYEDNTAVTDYIILDSGNSLEDPNELINGFQAFFKAATGNTGAVTVKVLDFATKDLTDSAGSALTGGEIVTNTYYTIVYNLTNDRFELVT